MEIISNNIRKLRSGANPNKLVLTQVELANKLEMSTPTLQKAENESTPICVLKALKMCEIFGVELNEIFIIEL